MKTAREMTKTKLEMWDIGKKRLVSDKSEDLLEATEYIKAFKDRRQGRKLTDIFRGMKGLKFPTDMAPI